MSNPNNISIQYSTNGTEFNVYRTATEIPIGVGEKVYFKWSGKIGDTNLYYNSIVNSNVKYKTYGELKKGIYKRAYMEMFRKQTNLIDASGLVLSATTTLGDECYQQMFFGCTSLTTAPAILPSTELGDECYQLMFFGCTSLTTAPLLPSTKLKWYCYQQMFYGCTSLTTAPLLPATELENHSYERMFYGCTSLTYVKHHIIEWDTNSADNWLYGVASSGTVECPTDSTIPSDSTSGIPEGWTKKTF